MRRSRMDVIDDLMGDEIIIDASMSGAVARTPALEQVVMVALYLIVLQINTWFMPTMSKGMTHVIL